MLNITETEYSNENETIIIYDKGIFGSLLLFTTIYGISNPSEILVIVLNDVYDILLVIKFGFRSIQHQTSEFEMHIYFWESNLSGWIGR